MCIAMNIDRFKPENKSARIESAGPPPLSATPIETSTATSTAAQSATNNPTLMPAPSATNSATATSAPSATPTPGLPNCFLGVPSGIIPSGDAYIRASSPDSNFGALPDIEVRPDNGANRRGLLRFDLGSIPQGSFVTNATLYLFEKDKKLDQVTYLYRITTPLR
jgi:hypothetical protein